MSLFPKRAAPGQTVTVHLRHLLLPDGGPGLNLFTLQVFAPDGERLVCEERELLSFLPALADPEAGQPEAERFTYTPLLLNFRRDPDLGPRSSAAEQELFELIQRGRTEGRLDEAAAARMEALMRRLVDQFAPPQATRRLALDMAVMRASSHFYWHLRLPADAAPGAYSLIISGPGSMQPGAAPVVHRERLFVDRPRLLEREDRGEAGLRAVVGNEAEIPTPVRLARPGVDGASTSLHELAPRSRTEFELDGPGFLLFAEGTRALVLSRSSAPLLVRRAGLVLDRSGPGTISLRLPPLGGASPAALLFPGLDALAPTLAARLGEPGHEREGVVVLDGPVADALRLADGLHQVDAIERRCGPEAVTELEALGLVRRVPLARLSGEEARP